MYGGGSGVWGQSLGPGFMVQGLGFRVRGWGLRTLNSETFRGSLSTAFGDASLEP